ncbi:hypothetical protein RSAG8_00156, partial [Rhizoctonia solani AG-8 WAC10335]
MRATRPRGVLTSCVVKKQPIRVRGKEKEHEITLCSPGQRDSMGQGRSRRMPSSPCTHFPTITLCDSCRDHIRQFVTQGLAGFALLFTSPDLNRCKVEKYRRTPTPWSVSSHTRRHIRCRNHMALLTGQ